jgi:Fe-Mn family superoxide dismutase
VDKRTFVKSVLLGVAGVYASGLVVKAGKSRKRWDGIFRMPDIPFSSDALEPFADAETLRLHLQHHASYTENLNHAVNAAGLRGKSAHELMRMISEYPVEIRNYSGGYVNHKLFWRILSPQGKEPTADFNTVIDRDFGSLEKLTGDFSTTAATLFGSGWVWLIVDNKGMLKITSTANHDNPVMDVAEERGFPLMCLDVWEHAYYIKNKNRRTDYIQSFWKVVNWEVVSRRYQSAAKIGFKI